MASTIAIADVLARVRFRLHLPAVGSGSFVTSADALLLAKSSVGRLGAMLNRSFGDHYFASVATLSTQAGVDLVSLPANFKDLLSLHWVNGTTKLPPLERADITEYDPLPRSWAEGCLPKYRLEANVLVFTPTPNAVYTLRCAYTTGLSITSLTDSIQGQDGWDEWLVLDICEQIRDREEKDVSRFVTGKKDIAEQIVSDARKRDRTGVTTVRDVRGETEDYEADRRNRLFGLY